MWSFLAMSLSQSDLITILCTAIGIAVAVGIFMWQRLSALRRAAHALPFRLLPVGNLAGHLHSPLKHAPGYVDRKQEYDLAHPFYVIVGSKGVGKSREALELVQRLARAHGAQTVYLRQGYVTGLPVFPSFPQVKKVLVLIDDYDYGEMSLGSSTFADRSTAVADLTANLQRTFEFFRDRTDLCGFVVTVNSYRLPISMEERGDLSRECRVIELPDADRETFAAFLDKALESQSLTMQTGARDAFIGGCDGQLGSVATYLSMKKQGSTLTDESVREFEEERQTLWRSFRKELTDEQRRIYDALALLRQFRLNTRLDYILRLVGQENRYAKERLLRRAIETVWPIQDGCVLTYDGQFAEGGELPPLESVAKAVLRCGRRLQRRDRAVFQEELKLFLGAAMHTRAPRLLEQMLRRFRKWYPKDRYLGYAHATVLLQRGKWLPATAVLFRYLREPYAHRPESVWLEVNLHLLLGEVYMSRKLGPLFTPEKVFSQVEREFRLAVLLTRLKESDLAALQPVAGKRRGLFRRRRYRPDDYDVRELGYVPPTELRVDMRRLRAVAFHEYARFLTRQTHRELDALACEEGAVECIPDFGEAHLNSATLCLSVGDAVKALEHVEKARQARPLQWDRETYDFMLTRETWRAKLDLGDEHGAKDAFDQALALAGRPPLAADSNLQAELGGTGPGTESWQQARELARVRTKVFGDKLEYTVLPYGLTVRLPGDWKIDREGGNVGDSPEVGVVFSSQVYWDVKGTKEADACMSVFMHPPATQPSQKARARAKEIIAGLGQPEGTKVHSSILVDNQQRGKGRVSVWEFEVAQRKWPKRGIIIACDRPDSMFLLHAMCQESGLGLLWEAVEETVDDLFRQDYFADETTPGDGVGIVDVIRKRSVDRLMMRHMRSDMGTFDIGDPVFDELFRRHVDVPSDIASKAQLAGVLALRLVHHTQLHGTDSLAEENARFLRSLCQEGVRQAPDEPAFYDALGIVHDIEGDHEGAREMFEQVGKKSGHAFWRVRAATSYSMERNFGRAVEEVERGMDEGLENIGLTYLGRFLDALGEYQEALEALRGADAAGVRVPSLLPELQRAHFRIMDVRGVLRVGGRLLVQVVRYRPGDWTSRVTKAFALAGLSTTCWASKMIWHATRHLPGARWLHMRVCPPYEPEMEFGLQLIENASYDGALQAFERALESCPGSPEVMRNIGATHYSMGNVEKARSWIEKAVDARPGDLELQDIASRLRNAVR